MRKPRRATPRSARTERRLSSVVLRNPSCRFRAPPAGSLWASRSGFYAAGPAVGWTLFDGGKRRANLDLTKARVAAALAAYEGTVLVALRDVESSLTAYSHD